MAVDCDHGVLFFQDLQKLPWESTPILQAQPVTRLPSFRFLLSYTVTIEVGNRTQGLSDWLLGKA